jgi:hypothetical protein
LFLVTPELYLPQTCHTSPAGEHGSHTLARISDLLKRQRRRLTI